MDVACNDVNKLILMRSMRPKSMLPILFDLLHSHRPQMLLNYHYFNMVYLSSL